MKALKVILITVMAAGISVGTALLGQRLIGERPQTQEIAIDLDKDQIETLPDLRLKDLEGREVPSNAWAGKVLILNFWATWCPPCLEEIPRFVAAQERLRPLGIQFVGIAVDQPEEVRALLATQPINYPVLLATPEALNTAVQLGNWLEVLPFTAIFDRQGRRIHSQIGPLSDAELDRWLAPFLGSASQQKRTRAP
ncbi:TlpA family protein disulfide reductase [Caldichromatium japonicum]|uniref:TlpA family protein disulfide reductase n=1 Tax=Caldichromatium japonicum TaxID=2699430 RepID=A0A6G7VE10_9GAMM|nr:TlpA disulfide reductase family protein [Caldichromatium japonicum]QIK38088.1 TlpA family protein disulfide reductase [Caldichromatium japonicum]